MHFKNGRLKKKTLTMMMTINKKRNKNARSSYKKAALRPGYEVLVTTYIEAL